MVLNMTELLQEYEKFMFNRKTPVAVLKSGLVVFKKLPDAKVVDFGCSLCLSLAEVKCPHTKFYVTPCLLLIILLLIMAYT